MIDDMKRIKRKVKRFEQNIRYSINSHGQGTTLLYLECGHVKRQKGSVPIPNWCICKECEWDVSGRSEVE